MAKKTFIGRAFISITGDQKGLDRVLSKVRLTMQKFGKEMQKWGTGLMAAGAAIQAPLTLAVQQFAALGDEIAKGAKRSGLSAKAYSELSHVAVLSGSSAERFEKSIQAMARGMMDAKRGTGEMKFAMEQLGLTWKDLEDLDAEGKFLLLADRIGAVKDPSIRAALAMKAFGKAGAELVPMFDLGATGIAHYRAEAERLGISMGDEAAGNAERLTDMFTRLKAAVKGLVYTVGNQLAPIFDRMLVYMTNLVIHVREYLQNNPQVVAGIQKLATALMAAGAALVTMGTAIRGLSVLVSPGGVLLALAATLAYISGALDPLIDKWGKAVLAFEVGGKTIEQWLNIVKDLWDDLSIAVSAAIVLIEPILKNLWDLIKAGFEATTSFLLKKAVYAALSIVKMVARLFAKMMQSLKDQYSQLDMINDPLGIQRSALEATMGGVAGISRAVATAQGSLMMERQPAEGRANTATSNFMNTLDRFAGVFKGNAGAISDIFAGTFRGMGSKIGDAFKPMISSIFGSADTPGGAKSITDIFKGLGRDFIELQRPSNVAMPGPALATATAALGTFSGRGAAAMGADNTMLRIQRDQLGVLRDIRDAVAAGGMQSGAEDW